VLWLEQLNVVAHARPGVRQRRAGGQMEALVRGGHGIAAPERVIHRGARLGIAPGTFFNA
jgi:hypothetical protein